MRLLTENELHAIHNEWLGAGELVTGTDLMRSVEAAVVAKVVADRKALQSQLDDYTVMMTAKCNALQAENERLTKLFQGDVRIKDIGLTPNLHASFEGGPVRVMAECYADFFRESQAPNYIEMQFRAEDGLELVATIQRKSGKTPHQLRQQAEAERDALQVKLDAAAKTRPLTDEAIASLNCVGIDKVDYDIFELDAGSVIDFARAIEAAHGIGGQQ